MFGSFSTLTLINHVFSREEEARNGEKKAKMDSSNPEGIEAAYEELKTRHEELKTDHEELKVKYEELKSFTLNMLPRALKE